MASIELSPSEVSRARKLARECSAAQIAEALGWAPCMHKTVRSRLAKYGISLRTGSRAHRGDDTSLRGGDRLERGLARDYRPGSRS
jgi:hypothetical protein